jgi:hypothetical protein
MGAAAPNIPQALTSPSLNRHTRAHSARGIRIRRDYRMTAHPQKEERLKITVTPNGSTVLVTGTDCGPGAEFVDQAIDLGGAKGYATHPMIGPVAVDSGVAVAQLSI